MQGRVKKRKEKKAAASATIRTTPGNRAILAQLLQQLDRKGEPEKQGALDNRMRWANAVLCTENEFGWYQLFHKIKFVFAHNAPRFNVTC